MTVNPALAKDMWSYTDFVSRCVAKLFADDARLSQRLGLLHVLAAMTDPPGSDNVASDFSHGVDMIQRTLVAAPPSISRALPIVDGSPAYTFGTIPNTLPPLVRYDFDVVTDAEALPAFMRGPGETETTEKQ
jgi:hypothetical protein